MTSFPDLVSVDWLQRHLDMPNLVVLDASINKVSDNGNTPNTIQIPKARFFDLKEKFCTVDAPFPNTVPSEQQFSFEAKQLGINDHSKIVVYDDKGIYSSPRAWWLFKAFGHDHVAVLNGGLPAWQAVGFPIEERQKQKNQMGNFEGRFNNDLIKQYSEFKAIVEENSYTIIDARSKRRFLELDPEPRTGLRRGTIPNSYNLPYTDLLSDSMLKNSTELKAIFSKFVIENKPLLFSCGSGITACILALGASISGCDDVAIYDGSWTEWGSLIKA